MRPRSDVRDVGRADVVGMREDVSWSGPMSKTSHGGAREDYLERFGHEPLDFSANVNPFGMSPAAHAAAVRALGHADRYPDPRSRRLIKAIAAHDGVPARYVVVGNGAADLIRRIVLAVAPARALVLAPTFSEYEDALAQVGCVPEHFELSERSGLVPTNELLDAVVPGLDLVFMCEPNNPTGLLAGRPLLERLLARCIEVGAWLVVDECFNGFLPDPASSSMHGLVADEPRLVVLSAFTKLYGMAGLRLGYLECSDETLLAGIVACGQPWPVSNVAQAAGTAALGDDAWVACARSAIASQREILRHGLRGFGFDVWPSQANYLLFKSHTPALYERLAERGIVVRFCCDYRGLTEGFYRVAVRMPEQNHVLLRELGRLVAEDEQGINDREGRRQQ